jgi:hypothetical protein
MHFPPHVLYGIFLGGILIILLLCTSIGILAGGGGIVHAFVVPCTLAPGARYLYDVKYRNVRKFKARQRKRCAVIAAFQTAIIM